MVHFLRIWRGLGSCACFFCTLLLPCAHPLLKKGGIFLLICELNNIVKYCQDRLLFRIERLKVYASDNIGIVGLNGSGKTTLLNIIAGITNPDEGTVRMYRDCSYITQFEPIKKIETCELDNVLVQQFNLEGGYKASMSGGEKTRYKIVAALSKNSSILLADEPTSNLDLTGVRLLEEELARFKGAVIIVSHDRQMLDKLCTKIWEIEDGRVNVYMGNYGTYYAAKEMENKRRESDYSQYVKEKRKLEQAIKERGQQATTMRKTPKRMGNSEARLHKMGNQKAKASLDKAVKAMETRIEKLERKEKPRAIDQMNLDLAGSGGIYSRTVIEGKNLNVSFGNKVIYKDAEFAIANGQKTAVIGDNGCGKTTLLKMILEGNEGIKVSCNVKFGYFSQDMNILDYDKTIIENVMSESIFDESFARITLARLLIKKDNVYKKVADLSGGERVRVSFAKIILSEANMLVLDEPTNYLDIHSMEAVETALSEYGGNLLFVSHDRRLINKVANSILFIGDRKIEMFNGVYEEYLRSVCQQPEQKGAKENRMLLEHRMSDILTRLSMPSKSDNIEALDKEYRDILIKLRDF